VNDDVFKVLCTVLCNRNLRYRKTVRNHRIILQDQRTENCPRLKSIVVSVQVDGGGQGVDERITVFSRMVLKQPLPDLVLGPQLCLRVRSLNI